jgi:hypothetical protein
MFDAKDETGTGVGLDEAASVRTFEPGTLDSREAESVRTSILMKSFTSEPERGFREAASVRTFEPDTIGCREAASVRTFDAFRVATASGAWRSSAYRRALPPLSDIAFILIACAPGAAIAATASARPRRATSRREPLTFMTPPLVFVVMTTP